MKTSSLLQSCFLVFLLLSAQLSSAVSATLMPMDCSMDMAEHSMMMSDESSEDGMSDSGAMDCCDLPKGTSCCDDDCHCAKLLTSQTVIENSLIQHLYKYHDGKHLAYHFYYTSLYLHKVTPPPIA